MTASAIGDWNIRGRDVETSLCGEITDRIIDADRLARLEMRNGIPNWDLYRVCIAHDDVQLANLRQWVVAFAIAMCVDGAVKRGTYSDELACVAAWDALLMLKHGREVMPYTVIADSLGVHHNTYKRLRNAIYSRLHLSLRDYWNWLTVSYLQVLKYERKCGS